MGNCKEMLNRVDERFELLALIFRLAGRPEYNDSDAEYQKKLNCVFDKNLNHPAVIFAKNLGMGYDAVFILAMNMKKDLSGFVENTINLTNRGWKIETLNQFLPLINDFYIESNFKAFFIEHTPFFEAESERFYRESFSRVDMDWFAQFNDSENYRIYISPSTSHNNYSGTSNNKVINALITFSTPMHVIIHEFSHSFGNTLGYEWYDTNAQFKQWCIDSLDQNLQPSYWMPDGNGSVMGIEYVVRAYTILYFTEHNKQEWADELMNWDKQKNGFPYIAEVYELVKAHEAKRTAACNTTDE